MKGRFANVQRAVERMGPELRARYEEIGKHIFHARKGSALHRYDVGVIVKTVMDAPKTYGTGAVQLLATALGRDEYGLYDAARVASCWKREELAELLARPTCHRLPLSFSHLVVLAEVKSEKERDLLVERCLREGLSVRALHRVTPTHPKRASTTTARDSRLDRFVQSSAGRVAEIRDAFAREERGSREAREAAKRLRKLAEEVLTAAAELEDGAAGQALGIFGMRKTERRSTVSA